MTTGAGGGYFGFDTNAEAVAARIGSSMAKIQAELSRVTARTAVASNFDTGGLFRSIAQVNKGFETLGATFRAGGLKPAQYLNEFRDQAVRGLQDVERALATQVSRQPAALLDKTNLGKLGRDAYSAYNDGMVAQAKALVASDPRLARSQTGQNLARDLQAQLSAEARTRSARLLSSEGLDPADAARLRAYYESQAAQRERLSTARLRQVPGLAAAIQGGDKELTTTAEDPGYRPRRDQLRAVNEQIAAEKQLANFHNQSADAQARQLKAAYDENERFDAKRLSNARGLANFENRTRDQQARLLTQAHAQNDRFDVARLKTAQSEAIAIDKQREALRVQTKGTQFGQYGRVGADLFKFDEVGATRILTGNQQQLNAALAAEGRQREANARAVRQEQQAALRSSGSLTENFSSGFLGRGFNASGNVGRPAIGEGIRNELATLGTVARYSGVYAVLGAVTAGIADTKNEVLDFTDSLTDLKVALNVGSVDTGLVGELQQIAVLSGSNTGAALDAAARGARAFSEVAKASGGDAAAAGTDVAQAATQIALITGKDLRDATGDVIAIASAFGLAASQANQVVDAVSAAKDFGGDPANISQGLANFATTAGAAGFTLGESANALSLVIARTDQSGQAAATRLSRITSILAGTTGRRVISELNAAGLRDSQGNEIDPTGTVKDQLRQIADAYQTAGPELQGKIRSALGGTANLRELLPLLEPGAFDKIIGKGADQSGRGAAEVRRRTTDLVGVLKKFQGDISAIQVNLFRSGLFDGLAIGLKALEPALNVLARLIGFLSEVPGPIRHIIGLIVDLKLALLGLRALGVVQTASISGLLAPRVGTAARPLITGVTGAAAGDVRRTAETAADDLSASAATRKAAADGAASIAAAEATVALKLFTVQTYEAAAAAGVDVSAELTEAEASLASARADLAETAASTEAALAGGVTGGSRGAGLLGSLTSKPTLITAAVAAAIAGAYVAFQADDKRKAIDKAGDKSSQAILNADLTDPAKLREAANSVRANAADLRESQQGWHNISSLIVKGARDSEIAQEHSTEKQLRGLAKRIEVENAEAIAAQKTTIFGNDAATSLEGVADALAALADAGYDGVGVFNAMIREITNTAVGGGKAPLPSDTPEKFAAGIAEDLIKNIVPVAKGKKGKADDLNLLGDPQAVSDGFGNAYTVQGAITPADLQKRTADRLPAIQKAALDKLKSFNIPAGVAPTDEQLQAIYQAALDASGLSSVGPAYKKLAAGLSEAVFGKARAALKEAAAAPGTTPLDPTQALTQLKSLGTAYDQALSDLPASDRAGRKSAGRDFLKGARLLQRQANLSGEDNPEALASISRLVGLAQEKVSGSLIDDMEELRKAAQAQAKGKAAIRAIGRQAFDSEVATALENGNIDALIEIFDRASQAQINAAIAAVEATLAADKAALAAARRTAEALAALGGRGGAGPLVSATAKVRADEEDLGNLNKAKNRSTAPKGNKDSEYLNPDLGGGGSTDDLTAAQIAAARRDAAVPANNRLSQAAADLQTARANLAAANKSKDPGGYYAAQKALSNAQAEYAAAARAQSASARDLRASRAGGELASARAAVQNARADLGAYTKGTAEYNAALGKLLDAQREAAEVNAKFRFSKRRANSDLTNDVQQARIDRKEAEAKLARDRRNGAGADVIVEDRIGVQSARNAEEQAAFSRRLQDAQTNEQLGRISHTAYIKYLQGEHDRLENIKHKSRQQIDQLNEIDQALKSANEQFAGQFNLGDIKAPTPYEARRAVAAAVQGTSFTGEIGRTGAVQTSVTNNFRFDGTDILAVKKVVTDVLGPLATSRSSSASRKA